MNNSNDRLLFVTHDPDQDEVWYQYFPASTSTTRWPGARHHAQPGHFHGAVPPPGAGLRSGVQYSTGPGDFQDTFGRASQPRARARQQPRSRADLWEEHTLDPETTQWTASEATGGSAAAVGRLRDELRDMHDEVREFSDERENLSDYIRHLHGRLDRLDRAYGAPRSGRAPGIAATEPSAKGKGKKRAPTPAESSIESELVVELLKRVTAMMSLDNRRDWIDFLHARDAHNRALENAADHERPAVPGPARPDGASGDGTTESSVKGKERAQPGGESSSESESIDELLKRVTARISPTNRRDWTDFLQVLDAYAGLPQDAVEMERAVMLQQLSLNPESSQRTVTHENAPGVVTVTTPESAPRPDPAVGHVVQ